MIGFAIGSMERIGQATYHKSAIMQAPNLSQRRSADNAGMN
jgi:hypothetical protein